MGADTTTGPRWAEQPSHTTRLLTVPQVAERLGVSPAKVWQLVRESRLRSLKIDKSRRVPDDAVNEFIAGLSAGSAA